jgi:hypothetical protein
VPKILFQPHLYTCHKDRRSQFAVYLSLLTPSILCHSDFVKSLSKAFKSLIIFIKLSRRSTVTLTEQERSCERFSKRRRTVNLWRQCRRIRGTSVHRLSSLMLLLKLRMSSVKLAQAHGVVTKLFHPLLTWI